MFLANPAIVGLNLLLSTTLHPWLDRVQQACWSLLIIFIAWLLQIRVLGAELWNEVKILSQLFIKIREFCDNQIYMYPNYKENRNFTQTSSVYCKYIYLIGILY